MGHGEKKKERKKTKGERVFEKKVREKESEEE